MREGSGAAAYDTAICVELRSPIFGEQETNVGPYLEFKAIDSNRYRSNHASIQFLIEGFAFGRSNVDELPFEIFRRREVCQDALWLMTVSSGTNLPLVVPYIQK